MEFHFFVVVVIDLEIIGYGDVHKVRRIWDRQELKVGEASDRDQGELERERVELKGDIGVSCYLNFVLIFFIWHKLNFPNQPFFVPPKGVLRDNIIMFLIVFVDIRLTIYRQIIIFFLNSMI